MGILFAFLSAILCCLASSLRFSTDYLNQPEMSNFVCLQTRLLCIDRLLTPLRAAETGKAEFVSYAKRLMSIICEEGLSYLESQPVALVTPTQTPFIGCRINQDEVVAVSIVRAGDSMLDVFLGIAPEAKVGKILIQRDEETAEAKLFYSKLPRLKGRSVVLLDPMLATGGSAVEAIKVLLNSGADEERIVFLNVLCCPEGVKRITDAFPKYA